MVRVGVEEALHLAADLGDPCGGGRLLAVLGGRGDAVEAPVRGAIS